MKKNAVIIILTLVVCFLAYRNYSINRKNPDLNRQLSEINEMFLEKEEELSIVKKELDKRNREFEMADREARLWAAKAYEAGYKPANAIKIKK